MDSLSQSGRRILEIETRQDELLRQLAALEQRIEQVLAEQTPLPVAAAGQSPTSSDKAA